MKKFRYFLLAGAVILLDQISKLLVYFNMDLNSEFNVLGDWFRIHYLLNPGMAFGLEWENEYGKLALTLFRLAAMVGIGVERMIEFSLRNRREFMETYDAGREKNVS